MTFDRLAALRAVREAPANTEAKTSTSALKCLAFALVSHADAAGLCWPSLTTLCRETALSRSTVSAAIGHLRHQGLGELRLDVVTPGEERTDAEREAVRRARLCNVHRLQVGTTPPGKTRKPVGPPNQSAEPTSTTTKPESVRPPNQEWFAGWTQKDPIEDPKEGSHSLEAVASGQGQQPRPKKGKKRSHAAAIQRLWALYTEGWREHVNRGTQPKLTAKRRNLITARLREGYDEADLAAAARGIWASDHHRTGGYTGPEYAWRTGDQVEMMAVKGADDDEPAPSRTPRPSDEELERKRALRKAERAKLPTANPPPPRTRESALAEAQRLLAVEAELPDAPEIPPDAPPSRLTVEDVMRMHAAAAGGTTGAAL